MTTVPPMRIGIFVFDDAEELDVVGPYDVLAKWAELSELRPEVVLFSADGAGVRLAKGLRVLPDYAVADVGPLREMRATTSLVASVCTGALVLAAAGLLAGRPATTYWDAFDELASLDPSVLVDTDARFVDDGDVVTSAGVSAGIDMALHLVARLETVAMARAVKRAIQYEPEPPV
jgi:transcriptional regulator GlxA family with amidase domain